MKFGIISVEGQTEETFVNDVLNEHLAPHLYLEAVLLTNARKPSGGKHKGGMVSYAKVRRDLERLLGDSSKVVVTTMYDLFQLHEDFPGTRDAHPNAKDRVAHIEAQLRHALPDRRFLPYLCLHEFEALLMTDVAVVREVVASPVAHNRPARDPFAKLPLDAPEDINNAAPPSKRLAAALPGYDKVAHGPVIAKRIGLRRIREMCPHFHAWLTQLEQIAQPPVSPPPVAPTPDLG